MHGRTMIVPSIRGVWLHAMSRRQGECEVVAGGTAVMDPRDIACMLM